MGPGVSGGIGTPYITIKSRLIDHCAKRYSKLPNRNYKLSVKKFYNIDCMNKKCNKEKIKITNCLKKSFITLIA